jgi:hypothetical protein
MSGSSFVRTATVQIQIETSLNRAASALLPVMAGHFRGDTVIMPSSMDPKDPVASEVLSHLPEGADGNIVVPVSGGAARRAFLSPTVLGDWRDLAIPGPASKLQSALVPGALSSADHRIIAVDVVEVARHGPFVLDLAARYVHPRQRVRVVADAARSEIAAEVASAVRIDLHVVSLTLREGTFLAVTTDPIAAELMALALAERCIGSTRAFTGPWEDAVVQRATELELGVLLPSRIRLLPSGDAARQAWADEITEHVRRRLGIPGTSSLLP